MPTVVFDGEPIMLTDLLAVSRGASVRLGDTARERIAAGRAVVEEVLASGRAVYGLTTGVGHAQAERVPDDELVAQQYTILRTHAGGFGPPLPTVQVRAAMAVRLAGLTRGGSTAGPAVADALVALLNEGVHPVLPSISSVGAGDLGALAFMARVAIGEGRAEHRGEIVDGATALARAGIEPLRLRPGEGLALISANGLSVGHGALVVERAGALADLADVVAALSMEAVRGNPSIALPVVERAQSFQGVAASCRRLRDALTGSYLLDADAPAAVQDPLSFRVVPQVHGALRDVLGFARDAVEGELNAQTDNPLLWPEERTLVSAGTFHPALLATAFDALRIAIAQVGRLADRRLEQLWRAFFAASSSGDPLAGGVSGSRIPDAPGMHLRYPAAAAWAELRQLAEPASLDIGPLEQGVEDHATAAPLCVRRTDEALDRLTDVLTVEALLANDALSLQEQGRPERPRTLGQLTGALRRAAMDAARAGRSPDDVHRALRAVLDRGTGGFGAG